MQEWLKIFKENYSGLSAEAKEIKEFLKDTYKGDSYVPWATMERLTYQQDPNAKFEVILNEKGGLVHTDILENYSKVSAKGEIISETIASMMAHFVKIKLNFLGKDFVEEYPIQAQDYTALKVYDQNAVNKALKRALAKIASRGTGLGLRLYENKDLQFEVEPNKGMPEIKSSKVEEKVETKTEDKKVTNEKKTKKEVETPVVEEVKEEVKNEVVENGEFSEGVIALCNLIKSADKDRMNNALQSLNTAILKQHNFKLSIEDTDEELCEKLTHFQDVNIFTKAIKNMIGA